MKSAPDKVQPSGVLGRILLFWARLALTVGLLCLAWWTETLLWQWGGSGGSGASGGGLGVRVQGGPIVWLGLILLLLPAIIALFLIVLVWFYGPDTTSGPHGDRKTTEWGLGNGFTFVVKAGPGLVTALLVVALAASAGSAFGINMLFLGGSDDPETVSKGEFSKLGQALEELGFPEVPEQQVAAAGTRETLHWCENDSRAACCTEHGLTVPQAIRLIESPSGEQGEVVNVYRFETAAQAEALPWYWVCDGDQLEQDTVVDGMHIQFINTEHSSKYYLASYRNVGFLVIKYEPTHEGEWFGEWTGWVPQLKSLIDIAAVANGPAGAKATVTVTAPASLAPAQQAPPVVSQLVVGGVTITPEGTAGQDATFAYTGSADQARPVMSTLIDQGYFLVDGVKYYPWNKQAPVDGTFVLSTDTRIGSDGDAEEVLFVYGDQTLRFR
ncbi:MAG: hypothetical protein LBR27_05210 [Bifidobacteriaceae bacterium]|jgi:hypothetical protein|nr:hypothetical protein [Bifidobacteriaceae bacterium]